MKFKTIPCPFCKTGHAHITYEENRVYQLNCPDCGNAIFRKDKSWDAAVEFFERMMISDGWIRVTERLPEETRKYLVVRAEAHGSIIGCNWYFVPCSPDGLGGWNTDEVVTHWMPLPDAPEEGT